MTTSKRKPSEPILSAHGIVNRFGKQVVHDKLDLEVKSGEILGIAGGSGSGKSVLLKTLIGLHKPESGEVLYNGKSIESLGASEKAALIGVLFQQGALFSSLSVVQNVMLPMREHTDLSVDEQEKLASIKLELAGLSGDNAFKSPSQLSGGMVKRAALARALALDPRILFLDEPTSDLDSLTASGIDDLILKLNQCIGITVVIVTHDLNTLFNICDRVAMLVDKKIIVDTVDKLMRSDEPWIHELLHSPRAKGAFNARKSGNGIG